MRFTLVVMLFLLGTSSSGLAQEITSEFVLEESMKFHDPESKWSQVTLAIHIQEPRIQNPGRYSKLIMDMATGSFSLSREYEIGEVERIISDEGEAIVLVNGSANYSEEVKEEYRLASSRNEGYRTFYEMLGGFPMSLRSDLVKDFSRYSNEEVFGTEYFMIEFTLKESIISDRWQVYFSKKDYSVQALKFVHDDPDEEDEIVLFDGRYFWEGITIPRYRHWYLSESKEYLGSDIIVKEL
ncbi:MAG: hypothetical protein JJ971_15725 [Balneolaceae bacterium]|nr:hypothetical protein [Balneolaceae bacterium]MBO6547849.1 hypothetical protein [Balneolaceae bacterium]MBO6648362.1 hypothetical protein [Balneolaceae bacterium]